LTSRSNGATRRRQILPSTNAGQLFSFHGRTGPGRPEDEEQWLDASRTPFVKAKSLLKPYPEELMDAHDVSPIVNSAKYDGPECTQPVSEDGMPKAKQLSLL
jgi:putative SOS response-associated peptidase YedK